MNLLEKLASLRLPIVIGEGSKGAKLLILGEALGETEVRKMRPFVGDAGWMLDDILRCAGVDRKNCYVMNVIPTKPPDNKVHRLPELGITLEECEEWCRERIRELHPNCILALGVTALECLTGKVDITDWRGSILETDLGVPEGNKVKVIPTFHPSYVKRMADKTAKKEREGEGSVKYTYGSARLSMVIDVKRAREESLRPGLNKPNRELIVGPELKQVEDYLLEAKAAKRVAFDIETMGKWVDCIGFSFDPLKAICIPRGEQYWGKQVAPIVDARIREFLWEHTGLVAQNGGFDITVLMGNGLPVRKLHFDTMIAHHWMYPELPHDLHYLTSIYTKEPYYKWRLKAARRMEERWEYNNLDAATTIEVARELVLELEEFGVEKEFFGFVMPLFHIVMKMGLEGSQVDLLYKKQLQETLARLIERQRTRCHRMLDLPEEFNLNSPVQLKTLLYSALHLPVQYQRKSRKVSVDDEAIERLAKLRPQPLLMEPGRLLTLLKYREVKKKKSTYADVRLSFDNRLRTQYLITGTETGRLSSKQTLFKEGWNSQNVPLWARKLIVPEEGKVLIEADLKYAEALLIAWFAKDTETIDVVNNGGDIYCWHASRMFGGTPDMVSKETRKMVKPVILGCGYGLGPIHLADELGVSVARGKELRRLFFEHCPAILDYQAWIRDTLQKTRTLITPFNRRRQFLGRMGEDLYRKGYAYLPQSSCAEYINRGMVRIYPQLPDGSDLRMQIHDSVLLEVRREEEKEVMELVLRELRVPIVIHGEELIIPVEIKRSEGELGKDEGGWDL